MPLTDVTNQPLLLSPKSARRKAMAGPKPDLVSPSSVGSTRLPGSPGMFASPPYLFSPLGEPAQLRHTGITPALEQMSIHSPPSRVSIEPPRKNLSIARAVGIAGAALLVLAAAYLVVSPAPSLPPAPPRLTQSEAQPATPNAMPQPSLSTGEDKKPIISAPRLEVPVHSVIESSPSAMRREASPMPIHASGSDGSVRSLLIQAAEEAVAEITAAEASAVTDDDDEAVADADAASAIEVALWANEWRREARVASRIDQERRRVMITAHALGWPVYLGPPRRPQHPRCPAKCPLQPPPWANETLLREAAEAADEAEVAEQAEALKKLVSHISTPKEVPAEMIAEIAVAFPGAREYEWILDTPTEEELAEAEAALDAMVEEVEAAAAVETAATEVEEVAVVEAAATAVDEVASADEDADSAKEIVAKALEVDRADAVSVDSPTDLALAAPMLPLSKLLTTTPSPPALSVLTVVLIHVPAAPDLTMEHLFVAHAIEHLMPVPASSRALSTRPDSAALAVALLPRDKTTYCAYPRVATSRALTLQQSSRQRQAKRWSFTPSELRVVGTMSIDIPHVSYPREPALASEATYDARSRALVPYHYPPYSSTPFRCSSSCTLKALDARQHSLDLARSDGLPHAEVRRPPSILEALVGPRFDSGNRVPLSPLPTHIWLCTAAAALLTALACIELAERLEAERTRAAIEASAAEAAAAGMVISDAPPPPSPEACASPKAAAKELVLQLTTPGPEAEVTTAFDAALIPTPIPTAIDAVALSAAEVTATSDAAQEDGRAELEAAVDVGLDDFHPLVLFDLKPKGQETVADRVKTPPMRRTRRTRQSVE